MTSKELKSILVHKMNSALVWIPLQYILCYVDYSAGSLSIIFQWPPPSPNKSTICIINFINFINKYFLYGNILLNNYFVFWQLPFHSMVIQIQK